MEQKSSIKTIFNLFALIVFYSLYVSCNGSNTETTESTSDSSSAAIPQEQGLKKTFNQDTMSMLSSTTASLEDVAIKLTRELKVNCPSLSIGTRKYYIVEGDMLLDGAELYLYCQQRLQNVDTNVTRRKQLGELTVGTDLTGNPTIWPGGTIIRYSIMRSSFESKAFYNKVVRNMNASTNDWMKTCNVRFEYLPQYDTINVDLEDDTLTKLTFIVREINANGDFIAESFFPGDPPYKRMLLIDPSYFRTSFDSTGVFRHELGHVLGFRHEQIWSSENACKGENIIEGQLGASQLTKYDPYSVMHYLCGNSGSSKLEITNFDRMGSVKIYGPPVK